MSNKIKVYRLNITFKNTYTIFEFQVTSVQQKKLDEFEAIQSDRIMQWCVTLLMQNDI